MVTVLLLCTLGYGTSVGWRVSTVGCLWTLDSRANKISNVGICTGGTQSVQGVSANILHTALYCLSCQHDYHSYLLKSRM